MCPEYHYIYATKGEVPDGTTITIVSGPFSSLSALTNSVNKGFIINDFEGVMYQNQKTFTLLIEEDTSIEMIP